MKNLFSIIIAAWLLYVPLLMADDFILAIKANCPVPKRPDIKITESPSEKELTRIRSTVNEYIERGNNHLECLKIYEHRFKQVITPEHQAWIISMHNLMVDEMQYIANVFNSSVDKHKQISK